MSWNTFRRGPGGSTSGDPQCSVGARYLHRTLTGHSGDGTAGGDSQDSSSALPVLAPLRADRLLSLTDLPSGAWLRPGTQPSRSWQPFTLTSSRPGGREGKRTSERTEGIKGVSAGLCSAARGRRRAAGQTCQTGRSEKGGGAGGRGGAALLLWRAVGGRGRRAQALLEGAAAGVVLGQRRQASFQGETEQIHLLRGLLHPRLSLADTSVSPRRRCCHVTSGRGGLLGHLLSG